MKRLILEMGTGTDLYGGDYTKAACRAVRDAIGHSSISLFRSCGYNHRDMVVKVTIAVQAPDAVDAAMVAEQLPRGVGVPVRKQHVAVCVHDRLEEVVRPVAHLHTRRQERGGREE